MADQQNFEKWNNTNEQKIWILMQVWAEAQFNFAFFEKILEINWEDKCRAAIPMILISKNIKEFYLILQELVAELRDGHTYILPPITEMLAMDRPAIEFQMIENKIIITRVGDSDEIQANNIIPGLEVIAIDDCSANEYLNDNFIRYFRGNTKHCGEALGLFRLLEGEQNSKVKLSLKDLEGKIKTITLTRNSTLKNGEKFTNNYFNWGPMITKQLFDEKIVYFNFASFASEQIVEDFDKELDLLNLDKIQGMIIDLRSNTGGNSTNSYNIISHLIDRPIEGEKWRTRKYLPAYRSWGMPEEWHEGNIDLIQPSKDKKYLGPLVILTSNSTFSAAEDFLLPLKYAKRATIIGNITAGSTGNPVSLILPGGYLFRICSKFTTFPDGEEFIGIGIKPDIIIKLTQKDIYEKRDIVLERAKDFLI